jgi:hypothetical protein
MKGFYLKSFLILSFLFCHFSVLKHVPAKNGEFTVVPTPKGGFNFPKRRKVFFIPKGSLWTLVNI